MENVYTSIVARDLEADGTRGSLAIAPLRSRADTLEQYMIFTGCPAPRKKILSIDIIALIMYDNCFPPVAVTVGLPAGKPSMLKQCTCY